MGQKTFGYLKENSGSVTGVNFAATGAPVIQIQKNLDRLLNNLMRLPTLNVSDETNTA
jgi:hypothetical protein